MRQFQNFYKNKKMWTCYKYVKEFNECIQTLACKQRLNEKIKITSHSSLSLQISIQF